MKCRLLVTVPLFISAFILPAKGFTQDSQADSIFYKTANENVLKIYLSNIKEQSGLLNGRMNIPYLFHFESGSPFFESETFMNSDVIYDGVRYSDIPIIYDQVSAMIIMHAPHGRLQLTSEKVARFTIEGHHFIRLEKDTLNKIATGFYEQLYEGGIIVLKKVEKLIREDLQSGVVLRYINQKDSYYLKDASGYHPVKKKGEILDVLHDHKQELQQFIKKNKLNFRKDMSNAIVQLASYYDQLTR